MAMKKRKAGKKKAAKKKSTKKRGPRQVAHHPSAAVAR